MKKLITFFVALVSIVSGAYPLSVFAEVSSFGSVTSNPLGHLKVTSVYSQISHSSTITFNWDHVTSARYYLSLKMGDNPMTPYLDSYNNQSIPFTISGKKARFSIYGLPASQLYTFSLGAVTGSGYDSAPTIYDSWGAITTAKKIVSCKVAQIGEACGKGNVIYTGTLDKKRYYVTPGGCDYSTNPTCNGTDTVYRTWDDAKVVCENLRYGSYTDWHLPTLAELNLLFKNKDAIGGFAPDGKGVFLDAYWSRESNIVKSFGSGQEGSQTPDANEFVRCVRYDTPAVR